MSRFASSLLLLTAVSAAQTPDTTAPPATQRPILTVQGRGAQVYRCEATGSTFGWTFRAPVARLFDAQDHEVGTHGDGPTWNYEDSSSIGGTVIARATPDAGSIPMLLLQSTSPKRTGLLTTVEYIRRSDTHGGLAPTGGCDAAHEGDLARIPYTAIYTFYSSRPAGTP